MKMLALLALLTFSSAYAQDYQIKIKSYNEGSIDTFDGKSTPESRKLAMFIEKNDPNASYTIIDKYKEYFTYKRVESDILAINSELENYVSKTKYVKNSGEFLSKLYLSEKNFLAGISLNGLNSFWAINYGPAGLEEVADYSVIFKNTDLEVKAHSGLLSDFRKDIHKDDFGKTTNSEIVEKYFPRNEIIVKMKFIEALKKRIDEEELTLRFLKNLAEDVTNDNKMEYNGEIGKDSSHSFEESTDNDQLDVSGVNLE